MRPLDDIGPYAETVITTRKTDANTRTDNSPGFGDVLIGLLLLCPALWVIAFMGLFLWAHIGIILVAGVIGLGFWACGHYGTDKRLLKLHRKPKLSDDEHVRIRQRLSRK